MPLQGLTKRRQKILTQAGLLFDHEKEKVRLAEEKRKREEEERRALKEKEKDLLTNPLFKSPLAICEQVYTCIYNVLYYIQTCVYMYVHVNLITVRLKLTF